MNALTDEKQLLIEYENIVREAYNYKIVKKLVHNTMVDVKIYDNASEMDCNFHTKTVRFTDKLATKKLTVKS